MILTIPFGGHATTAAPLSIENRPAIYRSAEDLPRTGDIQQFVKFWLLSYDRLLEQQIQTPLSTSILQRIVPSQSYSDELIDWDDVLTERPSRSTGKMKVTLKYTGHAKPSPIKDDWD